MNTGDKLSQYSKPVNRFSVECVCCVYTVAYVVSIVWHTGTKNNTQRLVYEKVKFTRVEY